MKLIYLILLISFINFSYSIKEFSLKINSENIEYLKAEIEKEKTKIKDLKHKVKNCDIRKSFIEMKTKSDPVFKAMVYGFPVPRMNSYLGDKHEMNNSNNRYKAWELCPPGCISGIY